MTPFFLIYLIVFYAVFLQPSFTLIIHNDIEKPVLTHPFELHPVNYNYSPWSPLFSSNALENTADRKGK